MAHIEQLKSGKYYVRNTINKKRKTFGTYNTLEEAQEFIELMNLHNWDLNKKIYPYKNKYHVFLHWNNKWIPRGTYNTLEEATAESQKPVMKYIKYRPKYNTYEIQRDIKEGVINYGAYDTLEEACNIRDKLITHDWDRNYWKSIYKNTSRQKNRYIYFTRNKYTIMKTFNEGENTIQKTYGAYETIGEARTQRDILEKNGWKIKSNHEIIQENGYYCIIRNRKIKNMPWRYYYGCFEHRDIAEAKLKELLKTGFPESQLTKKTNELRYISKSDGGYSIVKTKNYHRRWYGYYKSVDHAQVVRDYLEAHDWKTDGIIKHENRFYVLGQRSNGNYTYLGYVRSQTAAEELLKEWFSTSC